jgi:hypothetical protein
LFNKKKILYGKKQISIKKMAGYGGGYGGGRGGFGGGGGRGGGGGGDRMSGEAFLTFKISPQKHASFKNIYLVTTTSHYS